MLLAVLEILKEAGEMKDVAAGEAEEVLGFFCAGNGGEMLVDAGWRDGMGWGRLLEVGL